jgi:hypothetical protein
MGVREYDEYCIKKYKHKRKLDYYVAVEYPRKRRAAYRPRLIR